MGNLTVTGEIKSKSTPLYRHVVSMSGASLAAQTSSPTMSGTVTLEFVVFCVEKTAPCLTSSDLRVLIDYNETIGRLSWSPSSGTSIQYSVAVWAASSTSDVCITICGNGMQVAGSASVTAGVNGTYRVTGGTITDTVTRVS